MESIRAGMDTSNLNVPRELISETRSFEARTPVTRVISSIDKYGAVVITKGSRYYGIIDNRSLHRFAVSSSVSRETVSKYSINVPAVDSSTSIDEILLSFQKSRAKALPYFSNEKASGIIKRFTLLKVLLSLKMLSDIKASDAMTSPALAIEADATLSQARSAMRENRVSRLVVLQNGKLYGIITNHDLLLNYARAGERLPEMKGRSYNPSDAQLRSIASRNLIVVDYASGLADAARSMIENDVSSVIVARRGAPVGVITTLDIFESVLSMRHVEEQKIFISGINDDVREYEEDIRNSLSEFMAKAESIKKARALSMTFSVKKVGSRMYEMTSRLSVEKQGTIYAHATDYNMEKTLNQLLAKLMKEIKKKKEISLKARKIETFKKGMDEVEYYEDFA